MRAGFFEGNQPSVALLSSVLRTPLCTCYVSTFEKGGTGKMLRIRLERPGQPTRFCSTRPMQINCGCCNGRR
jgi:hypothetical protein